ncbi:MAG: hypothetical protein GC168_03250 [Candidatus Hydrogenedens sp.]|nr:hypothetical protein [Candidatus Hydrogenedens sp.]
MPPSRRTTYVMVAAAGIGAGILFAPLLLEPGTTAPLQLSARYTARFAMAIFLFAFAAPAWWRALGAAENRDLLLAFAAAHVVHLIALTVYRVQYSLMPPTTSLIFGGLAYVLLLGLAIALLFGKHSVSVQPYILHYLLFIVALTYAGRLSDPATHRTGVYGLSACAAAFLLRHAGKRWGVGTVRATH